MLKLHFPILAAVCLCALQISADEQSQCAIASTIEADVAEIVDGINTKFDASDLVWMDGMRAPSKADRHGLSMAFQYAPSWPHEHDRRDRRRRQGQRHGDLPRHL